jgi:hypothetical protein
MSRVLRSLVAALVTGALLAASAAPALAASESVNMKDERARETPVLLDALLLRPIGMVVTAVGTGIFCMVAPILAITRPTDLGKPFRALVVRPARYTWVDPLGSH